MQKVNLRNKSNKQFLLKNIMQASMIFLFLTFFIIEIYLTSQSSSKIVCFDWSKSSHLFYLKNFKV